MLASMLLLAALTSGPAWAKKALPPAPYQVEDRVQVDIESKRDDWEVVPVGAAGVVLLGSEQRGRTWTVSLYDRDFAPVWTLEEELDQRTFLQDKVVTESALYLLLLKRRGAVLLQVDLQNGTVRHLPLDLPRKILTVADLVVEGDRAWLTGLRGGAGAVFGGRGVVLSVDLGSGVARPVPVAEATGQKKAWMQRLSPGPAGADLAALSFKRRRPTLHLVEVGASSATQALQLAPKDGHAVLSAQRVQAGADTVVLGTFSRNETVLQAQGLYVAGFDGATERFRAYHSFTSFEHFFDYLPERRQARVERKSERARKKGKDLNLGYLLNVQDVVDQGSQYLVVAEAIQPIYTTRTQTTTSTDAQGNTITTTTTTQVFQGWASTHCMVAAFDKQGARLWDASFPMGDVLTPDIRDNVHVRVEGDRVEMVYVRRGDLLTQVATADGLEVDKSAVAESAEAKRSWVQDAAWWYDDRFVMWGMEKVKADGLGRKWVFAFSSVAPE